MISDGKNHKNHNFNEKVIYEKLMLKRLTVANLRAIYKETEPKDDIVNV